MKALLSTYRSLQTIAFNRDLRSVTLVIFIGTIIDRICVTNKLRVSMFHSAFFNSIIDKHQHMHFFTFKTVLV